MVSNSFKTLILEKCFKYGSVHLPTSLVVFEQTLSFCLHKMLLFACKRFMIL